MKILCADWLHLWWLLRDNHLSGLFKNGRKQFCTVAHKGHAAN